MSTYSRTRRPNRTLAPNRNRLLNRALNCLNHTTIWLSKPLDSTTGNQLFLAYEKHDRIRT